LPFDLPRGGLEVVGADRLFDLGGADAMAGHALRVEPQAHGQALAAKGIDLGHACNRGEQGLHHPAQVVAQGCGREGVAGKTDIRHGGGLTGRALDHRVVGLFRQAILDLVDLGDHLAQGLGRVLVQRHAQRHQAMALHRG